MQEQELQQFKGFLNDVIQEHRLDYNNSRVYMINSSNTTVADAKFKTQLDVPIDGVKYYQVLYASVERTAVTTGDVFIACEQLGAGLGTVVVSGTNYVSSANYLTMAYGSSTTSRCISPKNSLKVIPLSGPAKLSAVTLQFYDDQGTQLKQTDITKFSLVIRLFF